MYEFFVKHQNEISIAIAVTLGMGPFFWERTKNELMWDALKSIYHYADDNPNLQNMIIRIYVEHEIDTTPLIGKEYKDCK